MFSLGIWITLLGDDFWYLVAFAVLAIEELVGHLRLAADELLLLGVDCQVETNVNDVNHRNGVSQQTEFLTLAPT